MKVPTRRPRSSATPVNQQRVLRPHAIDVRYLDVLALLEPMHHFKYLTIPWLHDLCRPTVEYSVFRKYLGYLRQAPNRYIRCPEQQNASPNVPYKTLVYELAERGLALLRDRGLAPEPITPPPVPDKKTRRARSFAQHRAHSYYHEVIVDLGYLAPLHHLVRRDPALRLVDFTGLRAHANVPSATRAARDPLLVTLKQRQMRFDGTPHVLVRTSHDGRQLAIGIPGIQVDRGTETFEDVAMHLRNAIEFIDDRHHTRIWGFDNALIPFLFTSATRKARAMELVAREKGPCPFLLFKTIPDIGLLPHFPKPAHYDPQRTLADDEPRPPADIHVFTTPWQRVGYLDFHLATFTEVRQP